MKTVLSALAAVTLSAMIAMSGTAPAEAGPLRDAVKRNVIGLGQVGGIVARCAASRVVRRVRC